MRIQTDLQSFWCIIFGLQPGPKLSSEPLAATVGQSRNRQGEGFLFGGGGDVFRWLPKATSDGLCFVLESPTYSSLFKSLNCNGHIGGKKKKKDTSGRKSDHFGISQSKAFHSLGTPQECALSSRHCSGRPGHWPRCLTCLEAHGRSQNIYRRAARLLMCHATHSLSLSGSP